MQREGFKESFRLLIKFSATSTQSLSN